MSRVSDCDTGQSSVRLTGLERETKEMDSNIQTFKIHRCMSDDPVFKRRKKVRWKEMNFHVQLSTSVWSACLRAGKSSDETVDAIPHLLLTSGEPLGKFLTAPNLSYLTYKIGSVGQGLQGSLCSQMQGSPLKVKGHISILQEGLTQCSFSFWMGASLAAEWGHGINLHTVHLFYLITLKLKL